MMRMYKYTFVPPKLQHKQWFEGQCSSFVKDWNVVEVIEGTKVKKVSVREKVTL